MERRNFIKGGAAVALSATAAASATAMAPQTDRRAWRAAVEAKERALKQWDAFGPEYDRVTKVWQAGRPSMDSIDFAQFWPAHLDVGGKGYIARVMDLDERWQNFLAGEGRWWSAADPSKKKAQYRAALDSIQAFRDAEAEHEIESGMKAADDEYARLSDADGDALDKVMRMPAPDLAGLRWKVDYLTSNGTGWDCWSESFVRQTLADIERLMPRAH